MADQKRNSHYFWRLRTTIVRYWGLELEASIGHAVRNVLCYQLFQPRWGRNRGELTKSKIQNVHVAIQLSFPQSEQDMGMYCMCIFGSLAAARKRRWNFPHSVTIAKPFHTFAGSLRQKQIFQPYRSTLSFPGPMCCQPRGKKYFDAPKKVYRHPPRDYIIPPDFCKAFSYEMTALTML
jgi:hypothetical protein